VVLEPPQMEALPVIVGVVGSALIVTLVFAVALQLAAVVMVTLIPTGFVVPAVYVIAFVPLPAVMVPFVMFHA
jgi:hypothetical protein